MDHLPDYYQLLHVQTDAPAQVIKASYRAMMQKLRHHPDLGGDPSIAQALNEAVDTLCDPHRRACYDRQRQALQNERPSAAEQDRQSSSSVAESSRAASPAQGSTRDTSTDDVHSRQHTGDGMNTPADNEGDVIRLPGKPHCPFCAMLLPHDSGELQLYATSNQCARCKGPVRLVGQPDQATSDELRRIYRHSHQATVSYWNAWPLPATRHARLHELSLAGCSIETAQPVTPGSNLLLDMDALTTICQVRYCRQSESRTSYAVGLEFLTLRIKASPGTVFSATA